MKITLKITPEENSTVMTAVPGELDGFPAITELEFAAIPNSVSPDRVAVAGILAFGRYMSGQVQFDEKLSALTAELIARSMEPRWIHVTPLHPANLPIPRGSKTVLVSNSLNLNETQPLLTIVRNDRYEGALFGPDVSIISSNAWLIDGLDASNTIDSFSAQLAVGVLMAETLDISLIRMSNINGLDSENLSKLKQLLGAVGLGFEVK